MTTSQYLRKGFRDPFSERMLSAARFESNLEFPWCEPEQELPNKLITYSEAKYTKDYNQWICFNEDDYKFLKEAWLDPKGMLNTVRKFRGTIGPDFSMYRDMPLLEQYFASFMSRTFTQYWQRNGVHSIPNVRWADDRTFEISCLGVPRCSTIAIGSLGCLRDRDNRRWFIEGLRYVVDRLEPTTIVVYGSTPNGIFGQYEQRGIRILRFASKCERAHSKRVENGTR